MVLKLRSNWICLFLIRKNVPCLLLIFHALQNVIFQCLLGRAHNAHSVCAFRYLCVCFRYVFLFLLSSFSSPRSSPLTKHFKLTDMNIIRTYEMYITNDTRRKSYVDKRTKEKKFSLRMEKMKHKRIRETQESTHFRAIYVCCCRNVMFLFFFPFFFFVLSFLRSFGSVVSFIHVEAKSGSQCDPLLYYWVCACEVGNSLTLSVSFSPSIYLSMWCFLCRRYFE